MNDRASTAAGASAARAQHSAPSTAVRPWGRTAPHSRIRTRPRAGQSLVSLANGNKIRILREPKTTIVLVLDQDDPAEAVLVVRYLITNGELLDRAVPRAGD